MKQQDAKPEQALPHDLILEGRNKLTVTGVRRVIRCDAEGAALRPLFAAAEAFAGKLLLGPVRLAARCIAPRKAARAAAKVRRNEKRLAKKQKKSLPTPRRMLYNSNVSK